MFGSHVRRQPTGRRHSREERPRMAGGFLTNLTNLRHLCCVAGTSPSFLMTMANIMVWMKREKNGDNKRKKINEVYEEEHYRHITGHCTAIENKLLFDRQSLNDRYLKNCQFGVRDARANKVLPVTPLPGAQSARVTRLPSQQDRDRNCFSANALDDDHVPIDEEEVEEEEEEEVVGELRVSRGRSQSAVCHSASMRAQGMTLPDAGQVALEGDNVKDEGEDAGWDEGYGSKVSSNDQEQDGVEEDSTKTLDDAGAGEDSGLSGMGKVGPVLTPCQAQPLSHQDAMAKLMYSRRERTVYERLPSRRMRGNSFRYAGREQSRLTEASLSHINPAYLARYHHLADLAYAAQAKHAPLKHGGSEHCPAQVGENGDGEGGGKGLQPRTMVLRKITIQDSGKELFSQNIHASGNTAAGASSATGQCSDKVYQRQGVVSPPPPRTHSERAVSEPKPSVSQPPRSGVAGSEPVSVRVHDLTPDLTWDSPVTIVTSLSVPSSSQPTRSVMSMLSVPSTTRTDDLQGSSPLASPSRASPASDRLSSMSSFAVTDLLPAVERNLRNQRTTQRGLGKSKTMEVTASSFGSINGRHQPQQKQQQQQQQRSRHQHRQQQAAAKVHQSNGEVAGKKPGREGSERGEDVSSSRPPPIPNGMVAGTAGRKSSTTEEVRSFPGFRPYHHITPLQRAKEIANRRMHGHVTQMPDGSETVRVPSPLYANRTEQQNSHRRAKSASRFPPLLRQRTQQQQMANTHDVPMTTLSKAHSTLATAMSGSHGSLFTREDMAARLENL